MERVVEMTPENARSASVAVDCALPTAVLKPGPRLRNWLGAAPIVLAALSACKFAASRCSDASSSAAVLIE